jgi:hypothetical protein
MTPVRPEMISSSRFSVTPVEAWIVLNTSLVLTKTSFWSLMPSSLRFMRASSADRLRTIVKDARMIAAAPSATVKAKEMMDVVDRVLPLAVVRFIMTRPETNPTANARATVMRSQTGTDFTLRDFCSLSVISSPPYVLRPNNYYSENILNLIIALKIT